MPSDALLLWSSARAAALDEIENAHRMVGGTGPGRRYATQQINQAYAVMLASQFQGFCRDLHSQCVGKLTPVVTHQVVQFILGWELTTNRKLDRGNPNPGNIGADFGRLGLGFWPAVEADHTHNLHRKQLLADLSEWRNAIAHQDFDPSKLGGQTTLRLRRVREWRLACDGLAVSFDRVMGNHLLNLLGVTPW